MQITIDHQAHVTVVGVAGSIDALTADVLVAALQEQVQSGRTNLVAALMEVEYTSSAGLRVLLGALKETRARGGDLRLAGMQQRVHKVLELSGFTSILKVYPDVSSAVSSYPA